MDNMTHNQIDRNRDELKHTHDDPSRDCKACTEWVRSPMTHEPDFIGDTHGGEGSTHYACEEQIKELGGKVECCACNNHECKYGHDAVILEDEVTPRQKLIEKAVKRAVVEYGDALKKLSKE